MSVRPEALETAARLIVVRHGETVWNRERRVMGHLDSALTELGLRQAEALARRLRLVPATALYSSDLGRAMKTAACVARASANSVIPCSELREWNKGIFQGLTRDEAVARFPQESTAFDRLGDDYPIPEGESGAEFRYRCEQAMTRLAEQHRGEQIVGVARRGAAEFCLR